MASSFYSFITITIFQGIVNAIRKLGGRFLVLDVQTGTYTDIGEKKATEKTSQALREGQAQIRKDIGEEESDCKSFLRPPPFQMNVKAGKEMPSEDYFRNSLKILKSFYHVENNMTREMAWRPAPNSVATQLELQSAVSSAHMATVLDLNLDDQFKSVVPVHQQQQHQSRQLELETRLSPNQQNRNTPPRALKMPPRPRSLTVTASPDLVSLRQHDSFSTLSLSTWSLSPPSSLRMRDANSCASGVSFLSLSDTFSTSTEAEAYTDAISPGSGTGGDREFRAEEGIELMPPIELEFEAELMNIPVMNMDDSISMRGSEPSSCDLRFPEASSINATDVDVFNDRNSLV